MVQYKISSGNRIDLEGKVIYVKDITGTLGDVTYTKDTDSGVYEPVTNTTGYGESGVTRDILALYLVAVLRKSTGDVELTIKPYDPLTVDEWEVTVSEDGWYVFSMIAFDISPNEANHRPYYDPSTTRLLKWDGTTYIEALPKEFLLTSQLKVVTDKLVLINSSKTKIAINLSKNRLLRDIKLNHTEIRDKQEQYDMLRGLIEGSVYEFCRGYKAEAQRNVEFIKELPLDCC